MCRALKLEVDCDWDAHGVSHNVSDGRVPLHTHLDWAERKRNVRTNPKARVVLLHLNTERKWPELWWMDPELVEAVKLRLLRGKVAVDFYIDDNLTFERRERERRRSQKCRGVVCSAIRRKPHAWKHRKPRKWLQGWSQVSERLECLGAWYSKC